MKSDKDKQIEKLLENMFKPSDKLTGGDRIAQDITVANLDWKGPYLPFTHSVQHECNLIFLRTFK